MGRNFQKLYTPGHRPYPPGQEPPIKKRVATGLLKVFESLPQACEGVVWPGVNPSLIRDFAYLLDEFHWEATQ